MTANLDKARPYTTVGGRLPLFYLQDGKGYNRAGEYLGAYDAQGDPVEGAAVTEPVLPTPEPTPEPEAEFTAADPYKGVKVATMKRELEKRGLDFAPDATREELVAILVADDQGAGA